VATCWLYSLLLLSVCRSIVAFLLPQLPFILIDLLCLTLIALINGLNQCASNHFAPRCEREGQ